MVWKKIHFIIREFKKIPFQILCYLAEYLLQTDATDFVNIFSKFRFEIHVATFRPPKAIMIRLEKKISLSEESEGEFSPNLPWREPFAREQLVGAARCRQAAGALAGTVQGRLRQSARRISAGAVSQPLALVRDRARRGDSTVSRRDVLRGRDHRSSSAPLSRPGTSDRRRPASDVTRASSSARPPRRPRFADGPLAAPIIRQERNGGRKGVGKDGATQRGTPGAARPN